MLASIRKIILATDFSDISEDATHHAQLLTQTYKAKLRILHVFDPSVWNVPSHYYLPLEELGIKRVTGDLEEARRREKDALKELAKSFDQEVETIFTEGDPGHEIVRIAEEQNADLIVLGIHGYSGWKRFTLGSVAELVIRHAPCAVLTIRAKENRQSPCI